MSGFRKYIVIIGSVFILLWIISIIIYRDVIFKYISQSVGGFMEAALFVVIIIVGIGAMIRAIF